MSIFAVASLALTSCNMDLDAPGSVPDTDGIQTADDCLAFRNGIYGSIRSITSGSYVTSTELEMDQFNAVRDNGSRGLVWANGTINSATGDIATFYGNCYSMMKNINFFLEHAQTLIDNGVIEGEDMMNVKRYIAETKFIRAYIYYWLFDHYCQPYSSDKANSPALGLQLVTKYAPSSDQSTYPGRSTMAETVKLINDDLNDALAGLKEYEQSGLENCTANLRPNAPYLSSLAVEALQARVALLTQDYTTAIEKANNVINSDRYALCTGDDYINMWSADEGSELIFVPFGNANENGGIGSFMNAWAYTDKFPSRVDYVPSFSTLYSFMTVAGNQILFNDIRFDAFFTGLDMNVEGTQTAGLIFYKFPGNDELKAGTNEYKNKPKPFRLSEQYLILAEAAAMSNKGTVANNALNTLRAARIEGYQDANYSGTALIEQIREERAKELLGEGFRKSDLRRWGLGFKRDPQFPDSFFGAFFPGFTNIADCYITSTLGVTFVANDYRYTWPIPSDEMQVTPALKGQQNPGY